MWYIQTMEYYSSIKRSTDTCFMNEPQTQAEWKKPDTKDHLCMIAFYEMSKKGKSKDRK